MGDVTLHPDGDRVVYAVVHPDIERDANRSQLYTVGLDGTGNRKLSHGHHDSRAVFSPDGTRLAFVRTEPGQPTRIMVLTWPVGEMTEVASFADRVVQLSWLPTGPDEPGLVVSAGRRSDDQDGVEDDELARRPRIFHRLDYRFNGRGFIHDRPQQLFVVSIDSRADGPAAGDRPREIGTPGIDHGRFAISPDGSRIAATAFVDPDSDLTGSNRICLYTVDGSQDRLDLTQGGGRWASLLWHRDGRLVATGRVDGSTAGFDRPFLIDPSGGEAGAGPAPLGHHDQHVVPDGPGGNGKVAVGSGPSAAVLYPGVRRGRIGIDRYGLDDGDRRIVHEGPHQVVAFDADSDGTTIVAAITTTTRPAELWLLDGTPEPTSEPTRLVALNEEILAGLDLAETEAISVTSADGTEVEAFVIRPPASAPGPGSERPGLVYVHGGPMFQYGLGFFDEFQIAAACGYVVIAGNPRGSDGYGEAWAKAIIGDLGHLDWADVTAIADHLQALPEVDGERLGIGGGSYGGFMTGWALSHDDRFKAGLIERAVTSWNSFSGTSDIGTWFTPAVIGATMESDPAEVSRQSPLQHASRITVPTLIVHSDEDWRCPIEQAEQLFAAIRRNGGEVTMVRFPGENHELSRSGKPSHRIERFEIVHEFFARHLGGADFDTDHLS